MIVVPFRPHHIEVFDVREAQQEMRPYFSAAYAEAIAQTDAFTAFIDGRIVGCAGFIVPWPDRATCWALIAAGVTRRQMVEITHSVERAISLRTERRLEATCDSNFEGAHNWLKRLGFTREGTLRAYTPAGQDNDMYSRIK
jgi:RimJ/RimL family protein N-acetyltransferase